MSLWERERFDSPLQHAATRYVITEALGLFYLSITTRTTD